MDMTCCPALLQGYFIYTRRQIFLIYDSIWQPFTNTHTYLNLIDTYLVSIKDKRNFFFNLKRKIHPVEDGNHYSELIKPSVVPV